MKQTKQRTGLHVFSSREVNAVTDPIEDAHALLTLVAGTNASRLARIEQRAVAYADVSTIASELQTIRDVATAGRARELHLALLALERGLDLLDTNRYLDALARDYITQQGRAKGAEVANAQRAKLPDRSALLQEIATLMVGNYRSERDAKSIIRSKYKCSASALWQRLNPKKKQA